MTRTLVLAAVCAVAQLSSHVVEAREPEATAHARALLLAGHYAAAESTAQVALASAAGGAAEDSAAAIEVMVEVYFRTYRQAKPQALALAQRGVALRTPPGHAAAPGLASSLAWLAEVLAERRESAEADSIIARAHRACDRAGTSNDVEGALVQICQGEVDFNAHRYPEAHADFARALAIHQRVLPPSDPRLADDWNKIVRVAQTIDDRATAEDALEHVIAMSEHGLAPDHPYVARAWMGLARQRHLNQDYHGALELSERALALLDGSPDPDPNLQAFTCLQVAWDASDLSEDARAIEVYERAWHLFRSADGDQSPNALAALGSLAEACVWAGDCARAVAMAETSLAMARRARGDAPDVLWRHWDTLSLARMCSGDDRGALQASALALEGVERAGLAQSGSGMTILRRRGMIFEALGAMDSAGAAYRTALARGMARYGPGSREVSLSRDHLASWYLRIGVPDSARFLAQLLAAQMDSLRGPNSRDAGRARAVLAEAYAGLGDSARALGYALEAERIGREEFRVTARGFSERQALTESTVRARGLDMALALAAAGTSSDSVRREVWDALIRSRSLVFDEMASRRHERAAGSDSVREALGAAREELARLLARGPGGETRAQFDTRVLELTDRCDRAEREAAGSSPGVSRDRARAEIGLGEVEAALRPGEALLAYSKYRTERGSSAVDAYAAFARTPAGRTVVVPLGPASAIEDRVAAWRAELSRSLPEDPAIRKAAERRCRTAGERLRARVWDPLRAALAGASRVIVVPDGALSLIPFEALPVGAKDYLVEGGPTLARIAAERDLVRPSSQASGQGLLAMGGMDYEGQAPGGGMIAAATSSDRGLPPCREFGDVRFRQLPGTAEEASAVARLFSQSSLGGEPASLLTAEQATEAACRAQATGRRVIHLATHGFYVDPACAAPSSSASRGAAGMVSAATDRPSAAPVDPLRLSGLAFAAANGRAQASDGSNDGVLTAGEVAALDLEGTQVVTLSACESGLGIPVSGEGVIGLERAFHMAGAQAVVMSLWAVNDRAARDWMSDFYRALWLERVDAADASRAASLAALRRLRAAGGAAHPCEWAMFISSGLTH